MAPAQLRTHHHWLNVGTPSVPPAPTLSPCLLQFAWRLAPPGTTPNQDCRGIVVFTVLGSDAFMRTRREAFEASGTSTGAPKAKLGIAIQSRTARKGVSRNGCKTALPGVIFVESELKRLPFVQKREKYDSKEEDPLTLTARVQPPSAQ
jgi:hypothetical protein